MDRVASYRTSLTRKSHRKSRLGCGNCKARRIKCDERRPACGNCLKRSTECDFLLEHMQCGQNLPVSDTRLDTRRETTPHSFTFKSLFQDDFSPLNKRHKSSMQWQGSQQMPVLEISHPLLWGSFEFSAVDMALFQHYMVSPELGLLSHSTERPWSRSQLPSLGFSFHYVLRVLLAFSAFHVSRIQDDQAQQQAYRAVAERHYELAIRGVTASLPLLDEDSCYAVYSAVVFIFLCSLARGPRPKQYLGFSEQGEGECLTLFLGVRSVLEVCHNRLSIDVSAGEAENSSRRQPEDRSQWNSVRDISYGRYHLEDILDKIRRDLTAADSVYATYHLVIGRLAGTFDIIADPRTQLTKADLWAHVFAWLYRLPDPFIAELKQKKTFALITFAFFSVLLRQLDSSWFICGWPEHILRGVHRFLDASYLQCIQWPIEQIGWST